MPAVSAVTGEGVAGLLGRLAVAVSDARAADTGRARFEVHRPAPAGFAVEHAGAGAWIVRGRPAERAVALSDITNADALAYAQQRLRRLGVDRALVRAGVREGDRVRIGAFEFDYEPDS